MPAGASFEFEIDEHHDLVRVSLKGPLDTDAFLEGLGRMLTHPDFHPGMRILVDMMGHVHQISAEGIEQIAKAFIHNAEALRGCVIAVVVARTVSYGMLRMLQIKISEAPFKFFIFYHMPEAERALGLI